MRPEDLQAFLEEEGIDWEMRAHELPTSPDQCVAIRKYSGIPGRLLHDSGLPRDDQPRFQILVRSRDDVEAEGKADEIHDLLHVVQRQLSSVYAFRVKAEQRPALLMQDETGRFVYVFNLSAWVLRS